MHARILSQSYLSGLDSVELRFKGGPGFESLDSLLQQREVLTQYHVFKKETLLINSPFSPCC